MQDFPNLPKSWQVKTLGEVFLIERGGSPRPIKQFLTNDENGINWIKIGDTKNVSKYIYSTAEKIKPEGKKHSRFVEVGDLILSNSMSFGRPYIMKTTGCIHDGWVVFRNTKKLIDEEYAYYVLTSSQIYAEFSKLATGSTVKNLSIDRVRQVAIPIPPLEIQRRIVKRLDEAFSRIENGTKHLKSAKDNLTKYKQSLLKSAFNGTLTQDCPLSLGKSTAESSLRGSEATEAIHKIDCHESANADSRNDDKDSLNGESANLPQGWTIKTLGKVCEFAYGKGLESVKRKANGKYPVYAANGIKDYSDEYMIKEPSIIVGRKGSVGSLVLTNAPCWVLDVSYYVVFDRGKYDLMFLYHLLKTLNLNQYARGVKPGLSRSQVYELKVKVPPLETQKQIVAILERHFTSADKVSAYIESCLSKAKQLKSSLLKSAFAGELT